MTTRTLTGKLLARIGAVSKAEQIAEITAAISKSVDIPLWSAHQSMLQAEILMATERPGQALTELDSALAQADLVTLHESRASCYEQLGQMDNALAEWQLVEKSRERSFVEGVLSSAGRYFAVGSTSLAELELSRLSEKTGNPSSAERHQAAFRAKWPAYRP